MVANKLQITQYMRNNVVFNRQLYVRNGLMSSEYSIMQSDSPVLRFSASGCKLSVIIWVYDDLGSVLAKDPYFGILCHVDCRLIWVQWVLM